MRSRSERRFKHSILKQQRLFHFGRWLDPHEVGMALWTPAPCSCWLCGHAREWNGRTIQEKRIFQRLLFDEA